MRQNVSDVSRIIKKEAGRDFVIAKNNAVERSLCANYWCC